MNLLRYDLNNHTVRHLMSTDIRLSQLIEFIGDTELQLEYNGFKCLVKYIIGQQISDKARETIWKRLCSVMTVTPRRLYLVSNDLMYKVGLSKRKVDCIKLLARSIVAGELDLKALKKLSNDDIINRLIGLKGIGCWTAEMYLIFSLGRENVLSKGDRTIKRGLQWMYDLPFMPSPTDLDKFFSQWMNGATIVSSYLWKAIELGLTNKPFIEVIREGHGYEHAGNSLDEPFY